jgi:hypothetical protein
MPKNLPSSARGRHGRALKHFALLAVVTAVVSASLGVPGPRWAWATSITGGPAPETPEEARVPTSPAPGTSTRALGAPAGRTLPRSALPKKPNKPAAWHQKVAAVAVEPVSAVETLVNAISAGQRQIESADAYAEALSFLRRAQAGQRLAALDLGKALELLGLARAELVHALLAEAADKARVELYQRALVELGVAEYTGRAGANGADLQQVENQVEMAQLGDVAASDSVAGLELAEATLAKAVLQVRASRERVTAALGAANRAKARLSAAKAQVATSQLALAKAKRWALVTGAAPARPSRALLAFEGALGRYGPTRAAKGARGRDVVGRRAPPISGQENRTVIPASRASGTGSSPVSSPALLGPTILGPSVLTASQIVAWFASTGAQANTTVPIARLVSDYMRVGKETGVRADIAFAQSIVETGYFSFPKFGQDPASYNNFAGIGACDSCKHGWKFPSALDGVRVQMALLSEYAMPPDPLGAPGGLVAGLGVAGCCRTWMALSGVWATNPNYGYDILTVYEEMLSSALEGELQRIGLARAVPVWQAGVLGQR